MTDTGLPDETLDLLRTSAAGFAKPDGKRVRGWRDRAPGFDRALWRRMGEQGWLSILVPEADDGLGLGVAAAAVIAERLGAACYPEPFVMAGVLAPALLAQATNRVLKRELLPAVLAGDQVVAVAWQPADGASGLAAGTVTARTDADGIVLSGACRFVVPAQADGFVILAGTPGSPALVWVEADRLDGAVIEEPGPDGVSSARLTLAELRVPETAVLMSGNRVSEVFQEAIDRAVIVQCAELCGLMSRALEMTLDYLRTRRQFGVPIGSFQALQHRSVDLFIQQELARHATDAAVRAADGGAIGAGLSLAASSAKARAAHAATLIATQAIQLHGAIGFTDEYDLGLYVNRIVRLAASLGNAAEHRRRYGALSEGA